MPLPVTQLILAQIGRHRQQPRLFMLAAFELRRFLQVLQEGLLHRVLGIAFVPEHDKTQPVQRISVGADKGLDPISRPRR
jgi:hypothetical protein